MSSRLIYSLFAMCGMVLIAASLWLPIDFGFAAPVPTKQGSDLAILPGDCALFVTVRPADIVNDPLAKTLTDQMRMFDSLERQFGVAVANIERLTIANVGGEIVTIVRTRKPFDKSKAIEMLPQRRYYSKDKDKDGGAVEKPEAVEKKISGKSIHFYGPPNRWTEALCVVDRNVFIRGNMTGVEALVSSKVKQTDELADLLDMAGKHTLVAGFQGKLVRSALRSEYRRYSDRDRSDKDKYRGDFKGEATEPADKAAKKENKDDDSVLVLPVEMIPYKPLVMMKSAVLTLDVNKGYRATGRITFDSGEATDEGELALKTVLYVFREMAVMAPKAGREFRALAPLAEPLQKVFKGAKIKRKGNTLETSVSLTVEEGMIKKVSAEIAAEKKREEERMEKYRKDRERFRDKDKK